MIRDWVCAAHFKLDPGSRTGGGVREYDIGARVITEELSEFGGQQRDLRPALPPHRALSIEFALEKGGESSHCGTPRGSANVNRGMIPHFVTTGACAVTFTSRVISWAIMASRTAFSFFGLNSQADVVPYS